MCISQAPDAAPTGTAVVSAGPGSSGTNHMYVHVHAELNFFRSLVRNRVFWFGFAQLYPRSLFYGMEEMVIDFKIQIYFVIYK